MKKRKIGAPKKYKAPTKIIHQLEIETLAKLDSKADYSKTRTDIINEAINDWLDKH